MFTEQIKDNAMVGKFEFRDYLEVLDENRKITLKK